MFQCLVLECELLAFTSSHCREHSELTSAIVSRENLLFEGYKSVFNLSGIFLTFSCFLKVYFGVGEKAQQIKAVTALGEDPSLIPSPMN